MYVRDNSVDRLYIEKILVTLGELDNESCVVAIYFAQSYTFAFYLLNTIQNINRPLHLYNSIVFVIEKCYDLCN